MSDVRYLISDADASCLASDVQQPMINVQYLAPASASIDAVLLTEAMSQVSTPLVSPRSDPPRLPARAPLADGITLPVRRGVWCQKST